jgi:hypothetical protein
MQPKNQERELRRALRQGRARTMAQIVGVVRLGAGTMCMPFAHGTSPKADQSAFFNLASLGAFPKAGLILFALSGLVLVVSLFFPRGLDER